jgi:hypothetical protein
VVASGWIWQPWLGILFMNVVLMLDVKKLGFGTSEWAICKISREKWTRTLRTCSLKSKGLNVSCGREIWKCRWNVLIHFVISQNVWVLRNLNVWCVCWSPWNPKNVHKRVLKRFDPKQQLDVVMFMWLISLCKNSIKTNLQVERFFNCSMYWNKNEIFMKLLHCLSFVLNMCYQ